MGLILFVRHICGFKLGALAQTGNLQSLDCFFYRGTQCQCQKSAVSTNWQQVGTWAEAVGHAANLSLNPGIHTT